MSLFAVQVQPNELPSRMQMTDIVNRRRMRHAHMVNITPQIMREGMRADYLKVDRLSQKVIEMVRGGAPGARDDARRQRLHGDAQSRLQAG